VNTKHLINQSRKRQTKTETHDKETK